MRRTSRDEWQRHVAKWQASGLTCRRYAERASVNPSTLSWWKWKLGRETETHPEPLRFVEVTPLPAPTATTIDLRVGDTTLQIPSGFDPEALHALLDVLEARR